jgi:hypothetical protein
LSIVAFTLAALWPASIMVGRIPKSVYGAVEDDPKYRFTGIAEQLLLVSEGVSIPNAKALVME